MSPAHGPCEALGRRERESPAHALAVGPFSQGWRNHRPSPHGWEGPASAREHTFTGHGFQLVCSKPGTQLQGMQQSPGPPDIARDEHLVSASSI